jgi:putative membrane protein
MMRFHAFGVVAAALFVVLLGCLAVAFVIWLVRTLASRPAGGGSAAEVSRGARGILDERYARGEISREEFEQMKKDLAER